MTKAENTYTIPSNRFYADEVPKEDWGKILLTLERCNFMKEKYYNYKYDKTYLGKDDGKQITDTQRMKDWYRETYGGKLMDYYVSSISRCVDGMFRSQKQCFKRESEERELRQEKRQEKVESLEEKLCTLQRGKEWIKAYAQAEAKGHPSILVQPDLLIHGFCLNDGKACYRGKNNKMTALPLYDYERMIEGRIRWHKATIAQIRNKILRTDETERAFPRCITFGGRDNYKKKDTLGLEGRALEEWHKERDFSRNHTALFTGRHDAKHGNFLCKYDADENTLTVTMIDGTKVCFKNVCFPYRGDELKSYIAERRGSVGYTMERRTDGHGREYIIFKATITEEKTFLNYSTMDGVVSYDFNYDHFAWADVSADGQLISCGTIPFHLEGKSTGEAENILGRAVKELVQIAEELYKPLVREDLDFKKKKARMEYEDKKRNHKLSSLIYSKAISMVEARAFRCDIAVIPVNPAYTSLIAKVKYMKPLGISIHCAAAYVIGRRALHKKERLPGYLKGIIRKRGKNPWRTVFRHVKNIPSSYFKGKIDGYSTWKALDKDTAFYKNNRLAWLKEHPKKQETGSEETG